MKQNRELRKKHMNILPINLWQRRQEYTMEKGWVIPQVEKQDNHIQKNDTGNLINWKWIKGLNLRPETIKLLEENISSKLVGIISCNFWWLYIYKFFGGGLASKAKGTKTKMNNWDYIKPKYFFTAKQIINKMKRQST